MLLSFSVDYMRPLIVDGYRQYLGDPSRDSARVKRQTIRAHGPRASHLLGKDNPTGKPTCHNDMRLHLWWKSRTPAREFIGAVSRWTIQSITIARIRSGVEIQSDGGAFKDLEAFSRADGFDSFDDFAKYFVPNEGDLFEGALYRW